MLSSQREGGKRQFPVALGSRERRPDLDVCDSRVSRSRYAAAGKPLQCSARLHQAFHQHLDTNLGQRQPARTRWDFPGFVFATDMSHQTQISYSEESFSPGVLKGAQDRPIRHVWQIQAVTTLAAFIQLRPLKLQSGFFPPSRVEVAVPVNQAEAL